jgi:excisionase family DNA binding protein
MTTLEKPRWLTVKEAAHLLDLHEVSLRRKIARGEIPGVLQLGGPGCALRILEDELARWLQVPAERRGPESSRQVESRQHGGEEAA